MLATEDVRAEPAVGPVGVAGGADPLREVEDHRHRQHVVLSRQGDEVPAGLTLHVGGVDDGEPARGQPLGGDVPEHVEGVGRGGLVVLVVRDQPPAAVAGQHLGGGEVGPGEGGLARACRADEDDEAQLRDRDLPSIRRGNVDHLGASSSDPVRLNTASWVGGPTSGSTGPTGNSRTR